MKPRKIRTKKTVLTGRWKNPYIFLPARLRTNRLILRLFLQVPFNAPVSTGI